MEMFKKFKANSNSIALVDDEIGVLKYKNLSDYIDFSKRKINNKSVILLIADNSAPFVLGYVSLLSCKNVINILVDVSFSDKFIKDTIEKFKPNYVLSPKKKINLIEKYKTIISIYSYAIFETNYNYNKNLDFKNFLLLSTSGTTQSPKFVRLSKKNIIDNTKKICASLPIKKSHSTVTTMPLGYSYGLSILNTHLYKCGKIILNNNTILEKTFWNKVKKYNINSFGGVPEFYEILKKINFEKYFLKSISYITQAGGKLDDNTAEYLGALCKRNNAKFFIMYGQTEASPRMTILKWPQFFEKKKSIGKPLKDYKIKIINSKKKSLKINKKGEIVFYGDNVCLGYAKTIKDLKKGDTNKKTLYTGDLGFKDKDGYIYIVGRKSKFIKIYGKRLDLIEIEKFLQEKGIKVRCIIEDKALKLNLYNNQNKEEKIKLDLKDKFKINQNFIVINKKFNKTFKDLNYGKK